MNIRNINYRINTNINIYSRKICLLNNYFKVNNSSNNIKNKLFDNICFKTFCYSNNINKLKDYKLTITGIPKTTSKEDILKKLDSLSEIQVIRISKEMKKSYCHIDVKSFLSEESIKEKLSYFKVNNKVLKARAKQINNYYSLTNEENNNNSKNIKDNKTNITNLESIEDILLYLNKLDFIDSININRNNTKETTNTELLKLLSNYLSTDNCNKNEFIVNLHYPYFELEWFVLNGNSINNIIDYKNKNKKLYKIFEFNSLKKLDEIDFLFNENVNNDIIDNNLIYYNAVVNIKLIFKRCFENLIESLNYSPFLEDDFTVWKNFKLQVIKYDNNIINIIITIGISALKLNAKYDLDIIKKAALFKLKDLTDYKYKLYKFNFKFFIGINENENTKLTFENRYIDFDDISIIKPTNNKIKNTINSESNNKLQNLLNICNNQYNINEYICYPWQKVNFEFSHIITIILKTLLKNQENTNKSLKILNYYPNSYLYIDCVEIKQLINKFKSVNTIDIHQNVNKSIILPKDVLKIKLDNTEDYLKNQENIINIINENDYLIGVINLNYLLRNKEDYTKFKQIYLKKIKLLSIYSTSFTEILMFLNNLNKFKLELSNINIYSINKLKENIFNYNSYVITLNLL